MGLALVDLLAVGLVEDVVVVGDGSLGVALRTEQRRAMGAVWEAQREGGTTQAQ